MLHVLKKPCSIFKTVYQFYDHSLVQTFGKFVSGFSMDSNQFLRVLIPSQGEDKGFVSSGWLARILLGRDFSSLIKGVRSAEPGDFLFVHFSGHGTRLPAESGGDDDTGYDECIVPRDMNLITDDDFREIVDQVPHGCRITIVSNSCHSGGLIDEAKEQIGESCKNDTEEQEESFGSGFGFRSFLHKSAENALESRDIHLPSKFRHKNHNQEEEEVGWRS